MLEMVDSAHNYSLFVAKKKVFTKSIGKKLHFRGFISIFGVQLQHMYVKNAII